MKTIILSEITDKAVHAGLLPYRISSPWRASFLQRARRAHKRNLAEPGDCKGDFAMLAGLALAGLALAEAHIGRGAGWIPTVQKLGSEIAKLIES